MLGICHQNMLIVLCLGITHPYFQSICINSLPNFGGIMKKWGDLHLALQLGF
jgi:hypothetical protein